MVTELKGEALSSIVLPREELTLWSIELDRRRVKRRFVSRIKVEIQEGYHLYSISQPPGGPLPTRVTAGTGISVIRVRSWPEPMRAFDPKFGMETECHFGSVIFDVLTQVESSVPAGEHEAVFRVEYQLCDERTCLRPETREFRAPIYVEAAEPAKTIAAQDAPMRASGVPLSSEERLRLLRDQQKTGRDLEEGVKEILKDDPNF